MDRYAYIADKIAFDATGPAIPAEVKELQRAYLFILEDHADKIQQALTVTVDATDRWSGKYYPETRDSPAEYPELELSDVEIKLTGQKPFERLTVEEINKQMLDRLSFMDDDRVKVLLESNEAKRALEAACHKPLFIDVEILFARKRQPYVTDESATVTFRLSGDVVHVGVGFDDQSKEKIEQALYEKGEENKWFEYEREPDYDPPDRW